MLISLRLHVMQFGSLLRRYEIVPLAEKMSACQTLKACNLLGMFLLVCVTLVSQPLFPSHIHTLVHMHTPMLTRTVYTCMLHVCASQPPALKNVSAQWL